jgi:hypothetical protein
MKAYIGLTFGILVAAQVDLTDNIQPSQHNPESNNFFFSDRRRHQSKPIF